MNLDADENSGEFRLRPRAPFRLEPTVRVLQRRPMNKVDIWEEGRYRRVLPTTTGNRLVTVEEVGTAADPELRVTVAGDALARRGS
jgi:hypothetical protein